MERPVIHIVLHILVPLVIALLFYRNSWKKSWLIMLLGLLIDVDHFLANPVYSPARCSIGFHFLHGWIPAVCYLFLLLFPKSRLLGIGLVVHLLLDGMDCYWISLEQSV